MENTIGNKFAFFAQYYGQKILINEKGKTRRIKGMNLVDFEVNNGHLLLTPIQNISLEDAKELANMAFKLGKIDWKIDRRDKTGVWMSGKHLSVDIEYYFRLNEYGGIYSATIFPPDEEGGNTTRYKHNIGGVGSNIKNGIPYIDIVDTLRSKGFAVQYKDAIVKQLVEWGWVKLKPSIF